MEVLNLNQPTTVTLDDEGRAQLGFGCPRNAKYVFLPTGAPAIVGVYQGLQPVGTNGKLRIEPGQKRGVRTLVAGSHLITFQGQPGTSVSLTARPWSFWDYFG